MSFPPRAPLVPYGLAPAVVSMPMPTHMMVSSFGNAGRGALLPAPPAKRDLQPRNEGPPVTVFVGNISSRVPDSTLHALVGACGGGAAVQWKRVSTFGFAEFCGAEAALRCVRLLHDRELADKRLVARTDGKMKALVDTYEAEQRSRVAAEGGGGGGAAGGAGGYLDARLRALDEAAERRLQQVLRDCQHDINNYETQQKGTLSLPRTDTKHFTIGYSTV